MFLCMNLRKIVVKFQMIWCLNGVYQHHEHVYYQIWIIKKRQQLLMMKKKKDDKTDKEAKVDNVTKLKSANIGASFHAKGGLITFSYFVKSKDVIKCYLYWNGQVIRFMP
eukprot:691912_1